MIPAVLTEIKRLDSSLLINADRLMSEGVITCETITTKNMLCKCSVQIYSDKIKLFQILSECLSKSYMKYTNVLPD